MKPRGKPFEKGHKHSRGRPPGSKNKWNKVSKALLAEMIDPDRLLRTAADIVYADMTELYDEDYKLKPLSEWPESMRMAIKRIEPRTANLDPGDGAADKVLRVELFDKIKPLEMLFKHKGLLEEKHAVTGELVLRWKDA